MKTFTQEELKNITALLLRVDLKGTEAITVGSLLQKISSLIEPEEVKPKEDKK